MAYRVMSLTKTLGLERSLQDLLVERNDSLSVLDGYVVGSLDPVELDVGMSESTGDVEGSLDEGRRGSAKVGRRRARREGRGEEILTRHFPFVHWIFPPIFF